MWDSYGYRSRQRSPKNDRSRIGRKLRIPLVHASIKISQSPDGPQVIEGALSLIDFTPEGMTLFIEAPLAVGEEVSITLEQPKQFYARGKVAACGNYLRNSKVLCESRRSYRVNIRFEFDSDAEREEVKRYFDYICSDILNVQSAA
jgi:hypothetical protein